MQCVKPSSDPPTTPNFAATWWSLRLVATAIVISQDGAGVIWGPQFERHSSERIILSIFLFGEPSYLLWLLYTIQFIPQFDSQFRCWQRTWEQNSGPPFAVATVLKYPFIFRIYFLLENVKSAPSPIWPRYVPPRLPFQLRLQGIVFSFMWAETCTAIHNTYI